MPTSYQQWVWEGEAHINWSMVTYQGSTRSKLPLDLLALCRRTLNSERIGTQLRDPINSRLTRWRMAVSQMDAAAELGRNPVNKQHIQPEYGDGQADAGRDG